MLVNEAKKKTEDKMKSKVQLFKRDLLSIQTGRAKAGLLDKVKVSYFGNDMSVNQVATISTPDSRTLLVTPWDKSLVSEIEKAIQKSDLGLTPNNDGEMVRITIPVLTEERRNEFIKMARKMAEESKIGIRNIRREMLRNLEEENPSEDVLRRVQEEIQKVTDRYIKEIEKIAKEKEEELSAI